MKLDANISILVSEDGVRIEIEDDLSNETIANIELSSDVFCAALGRLSYNRCELEMGDKDKFGKKMINKKFEFKLPTSNFHNRESIAKEEIKKVCPIGWEFNNYFSSQGSFFKKGDESWARCTIRQWVEVNKINKVK